MKFSRNAKATWQGAGQTGTGALTTQSGVLDKTPYSFSRRFGDEKGTNPEELIGAAHAGCFTMKLSFVLNEAGFTADSLETSAKVTFEDGKISHILLELNAKIPAIEDSKFQELARVAKDTCPVSLTLNSTIDLNAKLI